MEEEIKKSEEVETNVIKDIPGVEGQVMLRKFDTEDLMTLRNEGLETIVDTSTGKESINMKLGSMMKWNIILGIKSAPFFEKAITEERGAQVVVNSRLKDFRKIPPQAVDFIFQKVKDYNSVKYDDEFAKK